MAGRTFPNLAKKRYALSSKRRLSKFENAFVANEKDPPGAEKKEKIERKKLILGKKE